MPRYNRRSRWNWERAGQGAASGAATGFSVAGGKGAAVGGTLGFFTGGLSGRDTSVNRVPYTRAIKDFSTLRRRSARFAADEHSSQTGASFQRRGLNTSELAGGVISANRGRFMRDAETDIAKFAADINLRIAEAEQQAEMADDELTRKGWLDLAGHLGLMAVSGEFKLDKELSEGMLASLKQSHPEDVEKWIRGGMADEDLVGIYTRYAKLHGEPGSLNRRFSNLEMNTGGSGPVPEAHLPETASVRSSGNLPDIARDAVSTLTTSEGGEESGSVNIQGKPVVPIEANDSEAVKQAKRVFGKDEYEIMKAIEPDFETLITGNEPANVKPSLATSWKDTRDARTELPVEAMGADEPLWHADFLAEQSDAKLLERLEDMKAQLADPNQTDAFKQRAQMQIDLIGEEIQERMWPKGESTKLAFPPIEHPGNREMAEAAHRWIEEEERIPRESRIMVDRHGSGVPGVEAPRAERRARPNRTERIPQRRHPMQRRPYLEADPYETMSPPPPPDLSDVPVETTPPKVETKQPAQRRDTSSGRRLTIESESAPPDNALVKEAYRMVGKMEKADKEALMKYFDSANIKYFGESVDPTVVAWCAVYLNAALKKAGYVPLDTDTYAARGYMNYGTEGTGAVGDIVVWENHVAIIVQKMGNVIKVLGGNQKDGVTIANKADLDAKMTFLGYRKPVQSEQSRGNSRNTRRSRFTG